MREGKKQADRVRLLAMYLPQFHRVKENDEWWGNGFTDWTTVKKATPLFPGHKQPQHPLNQNYYDLIKKETMIWQANLAKKYRVDGFCFYHYYFKDGRKILEKPAENLLQWKDIEMPFCFNWANESWARTWTKFSSNETVNVWTDKSQTESSGPNILLKQEYGVESDWDEHFFYLLPFFKDERYIKYEGSPVFMIHQPDEIPRLIEMSERWNTLAKKSGFPSIYLIGDMVKSPFADTSKALQGLMLHFPTVALAQTKPESRIGDILQYDYEEICRISLSYDTELYDERASYYCVGPGFDTTPRHSTKGCILTNRSVEVFRKTLAEMVVRSRNLGKAFIFLNAWNEWGESMHLEPDEEDGFAYLEAIKGVVERDTADTASIDTLSEREKSLMRLISQNGEKAYRSAIVKRYMDIWLNWLQTGGGLVKYLRDKGYERVAIYGYGYMGKHILKELKKGNFVPVCLIDKKAESIMAPFPILTPTDDFPQMDVILVSNIWNNDEIRYAINERTNVPILFLKEILDEIDIYEIT